ncbi:MAG: hypothetical protein R3C14_06070 [Caldilineaceae bacterium]
MVRRMRVIQIGLGVVVLMLILATQSWVADAQEPDSDSAQEDTNTNIYIPLVTEGGAQTAQWPAKSAGTPRTARSSGVGNAILERALQIELGQVRAADYEQRLSSGPLYAMLQASGELDRRAAKAAAARGGNWTISRPNTQGCQNRFGAEKRGGEKSVRVNQDCSLRRQAEEVIAINPTNPNNLIVGQNDSRIGFNHCGYAWSFDGGETWGDQVPPFWGFLLAGGHTADACSDPTATFDAKGNAYIGGILFDVNSAASAFVIAKSNAGIGGAYFHSPAPGPFQEYSNAPLGVIANDNDPNVAHDKEFIVADANRRSPKQGNVYATWTRFAVTANGVGGNSPIYFSQSTDGGATWSSGIEISGSSATICGLFSGSADPNACDQDQGSHPIVGPDGTVYVAFSNFNTPLLGVNQILFVSCPVTADCTDAAGWAPPVKVNDLIGTQPLGPDPATGCAAGRGCLPPNGYRVPEVTSISISVDRAGNLFAVWADFRNGGGSCDWQNGTLGSAATAVPPCDNDVFYAYSTDHGQSWSDAIKLSPADSAQWMPWSAVTPKGDVLWVAYYDRSYGNCEFTGCADITLVQVNNPASRRANPKYDRLTTGSMPNLLPANNPVEAGFLGDYMWVAVDKDGAPHVVWADTRGLNNTVEEDIYFTKGFNGRAK